MKNQQFIDRFETETSQLEELAARRLNVALDFAYKQIESQLRKRYPELANSGSLLQSADAIRRLEQLKDVLILVKPEIAKQLENSFQEILQLSNQAGEELAAQLISASAPEGWPVRPGEIAIEAASFAAKNAIDSLNQYSAEFRSLSTILVTQGIIQGWGTAKTATLLRNQLGITKGKAELIARTEVLAAFNQAATATYVNSGIEFVQIIATGDLRTCGTCVYRNLKVYKAQEVSPPFHPRCRCAIIPWDKKWQSDEVWLQIFDSTVRNQFSGSLNSGASAFEKLSGRNAPVPVWTPAEL